jgi:hypothetical protein
MKNVIVHLAAVGAIIALSACGSANGVVPQAVSQSGTNTGVTSSAPQTSKGHLKTASLAGYGRPPDCGYATNP